jgi:3-phosphoshikimate 1-carboxyvinyltransferase
MSEYKVTSIKSLNAEFSVPGDKSMSHRSVMIAGIANGISEVRNFLPSEDCLNTLKAMESCGVCYEVLEEMDGFGPTALRIQGKNMELDASSSPIDCGNSGTGMRLLAGLLAPQSFDSKLFGDASLSSRPMGRIIKPLSAMGANIETKGEKDGCAPLVIHGKNLQPITYEMPVASAQVKSAILLAGMFCKGKTIVIQPADTRDHTERMLEAFSVKSSREGNAISLEGGQVPQARDFLIPGDISSGGIGNEWL